MRNPELINLLQDDSRYRDLAVPFSLENGPSQIKDAEFLIRNDGIIFNVEGYSHPATFVVGEVLYAPDKDGDKNIFGQPYKKVTLYKGTYEPVPYYDRGRLLREIDPALDQNGANPYFAHFKQILPASDFVAHLPSARGLERALSLSGRGSERFQQDFHNLMNLLDLRPEEISLGLTGAPLLGNTEVFHDLDIVFSGSLQENLRIAKTMRDLARSEPDRRLFEGGKAWQIRFFNDLGTLMCTFFTYPDRSMAPLHDFSMEVLEHGITVEGIVSDDSHSMYTPTILELKDVAISKNDQLVERFTSLPLIVYHTASRGDCFNEDVVRAKGALVKVTQDGGDFLAVCVIDREGVRNLTPPWKGYYAA
ncbi:hypothetical protein H3C70_04375 [Patescibacteria group bacterium]|nr:hypothetical protein [Patescibacteria group bacterium]